MPAWISNHLAKKMCDEIDYPFPYTLRGNFEVLEWLSYVAMGETAIL